MYGHHITHHRGVAGGRWKRKAPKTPKISLPNLHTAWMIENGKRVKRRFCTSCLRMVKKAMAEKAETKVA